MKIRLLDSLSDPNCHHFYNLTASRLLTRIKPSQNESLPSSKCCKNTLQQIQKLIQLQSLSNEQSCEGCYFSYNIFSSFILQRHYSRPFNCSMHFLCHCLQNSSADVEELSRRKYRKGRLFNFTQSDIIPT